MFAVAGYHANVCGAFIITFSMCVRYFMYMYHMHKQIKIRSQIMISKHDFFLDADNAIYPERSSHPEGFLLFFSPSNPYPLELLYLLTL